MKPDMSLLGYKWRWKPVYRTVQSDTILEACVYPFYFQVSINHNNKFKASLSAIDNELLSSDNHNSYEEGQIACKKLLLELHKIVNNAIKGVDSRDLWNKDGMTEVRS